MGFECCEKRPLGGDGVPPTPRKICVFTGSRADYGLLLWLMKTLNDDSSIALQILVSGTHLCREFGETVNLLEADGLRATAEVEMVLAADTPVAVATSLGLATIRYAQTLESLHPDIAVVLGDRYEALALAQAAMLLKIPIAHIHGGEATEGVIDEAIRHAISKMAQLHFTAAEVYRRRVVQLGEHPDRVFNVGAPGLDNIVKLDLPTIRELEESIEFTLGKRFAVVTYHPVTLGRAGPEASVTNLLAALDRFPDLNLLVTKSNADPFGRRINTRLDEYAAGNPERVRVVASLGQRNYLGALTHAVATIGNSSSGIIEAPAVGTPTVNIGERQRGRLRAPSVIDCADSTAAIVEAIEHAMTASFQALAANCVSPYGSGGASQRIAEIITTHPLENILDKRFFELATAAE